MTALAACPGCITTPAAVEAARVGAKGGQRVDYHFALPTIHCAACIATVERGLVATPGVVRARVNLTLKRVKITVAAAPADAGTEDALARRLADLGFPAELLDGETLDQRGRDDAGRALLLRLAIAGFAAMNVMMLSAAVWAGAEGATRDMLHWVSAVIALPAALFAAQPFFNNAWAALKVRRMVMDTPISVAILLALGTSLYETTQGGHEAYFDAALSLTFFLLLGRVLDHRARATARSAAAELAALEVPRAERLIRTADETRTETVPLSALAPGELIRVRPGMRVPVDGIVAVGATEIDRSLLTGETAPVAAGPGDAVHAGEANLTGRLTVRVSATGADTRLAQITELVRAGEAARNSYVTLADQAARIYAPVVHLLALATGIAWFAATGEARVSINTATAVLIITCPCALGLAVPSVMVAASSALFRRGVLLKDGTALERLAQADAVVVDKTGTLTTGVPDLMAADTLSDADLALAGALGAATAHPLGQRLEAEALARALPLPRLDALREVPGQGIEATLDGVPVRLGRASWLGLNDSGLQTTTWLQRGFDAPVPFRFADHARPGLRAMLSGLVGRVGPVTLLSGDAPGPVARLAREYDIATAVAGLTPADKQARVAALGARGHRVLMLGDGLNDTAALAAAHVSMAPSSGMDVARTASDIVLMTPDLSVVPQIVAIARSARRRMLENFGVAAVYNAIAIPLAMAGLVTPLIAALAMSGSSIVVSLNAMRVQRGAK